MDTTEDRIETPSGTVCLCYLSPDAILAVSGKDVGWLTVDGARRYANQRFTRDADGTWSPSQAHAAFANVVADGSRVSSDPCPPHVAAEAGRLLRETMLGWMRDRPDRAAEADLVSARDALRRNAAAIASLRDALEREVGMRAILEGRVSDRQAALDAFASDLPSP